MVCVRGGVIQCAVSDRPDVEFIVFNEDELKEQGVSQDEIDRAWEQGTGPCTHVIF
jgi:hypothetical protein